MKFVSTSLLTSSFLLLPAMSYAQLDPSYELLLGSSTHNSAVETIKSEKAHERKKRKPSNAEALTNVQVLPATTPTPALPATTPESPVAEAQKILEEPTFSQQAQSFFSSDAEKINNFYESKFAENDHRQNKVEISFAPGFETSESSSNFSYRNYRSVFAGMNLGANVWLTPAIGIGGNYIFSLGADTSGDAVTGTRSPARFELLDLGFKFRKFFGFSPTSKSLEFNLLYSDSKLTVPSDDLFRARLKTSGFGLKMTLRVPTSAEVAWLVGGSLYPRLQHTEETSGVSISSGSNIENTRLGLQLGTEINLSQQSQIFYEVSASSEKNLFEGPAAIVDPATGTKPKNVSVTNSLYIFSLGYRWGN